MSKKRKGTSTGTPIQEQMWRIFWSKILDRFWSSVDQHAPNGCWLWTGSISPGGYGIISMGTGKRGAGKHFMAHRFAWELLREPIPEGMVIDHRICRNKRCVNPDHMVVCTIRENGMQPDGGPARQMAKRICRNGHPLDGENIWYDNNGRRHCQICRLNHRRSWIAKRKLSSTIGVQ